MPLPWLVDNCLAGGGNDLALAVGLDVLLHTIPAGDAGDALALLQDEEVISLLALLHHKRTRGVDLSQK